MVSFEPKWCNKMHIPLITTGKKANRSFKEAIVLELLNCVNIYVYMIYVNICIPGYKQFYKELFSYKNQLSPGKI